MRVLQGMVPVMIGPSPFCHGGAIGFCKDAPVAVTER